VPSLLLQPIVENAVRHAVAPRTKGGRIQVSAQRVGDRLHLAVEDDGPGMSERELREERVLRPADAGHQDDNESADARHHDDNGGGNGIGLSNTRERLRYLYGERQQFTLDRGALNGLRFSALRTPSLTQFQSTSEDASHRARNTGTLSGSHADPLDVDCCDAGVMAASMGGLATEGCWPAVTSVPRDTAMDTGVA